MPSAAAIPPAAIPTPPTAEDLLAIVRTLPDVVFRCVKDRQGRIVWTLNEGRLAEEFHVTTRDVAGKTLFEMFPPDVAERQLPYFEAAFRGEVVEWVNEIGGRRFKHYPQPVRGPDGRVVAVVGFITEVTTLVQAQQRAEALNLELLQRMQELAAANRQLAQANRDLEGFASSVSHDLAQPLSVLANLAFVVRSRMGDRLDEASRGALDRIAHTVRGMGDLTQDLLRFSRAAQQPLRAEDLDLAPLAWEVARGLQAQEPTRHVDWRIPRSLPARGDPGLLRVVLANLLGNAWKYTGRVAAPAIEVRAEATPEGPAVAVADNGVGFDPAEAGRLFQAFERLASGGGFPGTGLGLATVRRIVERHGGRIWAEAAPGRGATFTFTLAPAAAGAHAVAAA